MGKVLLRLFLIFLFLSFLGLHSFAGGGNLGKHIPNTNRTKAKKAAPPVDVITTSTGGTIICGSSFITLTASAAPLGATYQWYGNTFLIPGATAQTYITNLPGTYYVVATYLGVPDQYPSIILTGSTPPTVSYTYSSPSICGNAPITYTSSATGTGLTYSWNFGDGSALSTQQNPVHRFVTKNGGGQQSFTVALTVTNSDGCSTVNSQLVTINQPSSLLAGNNATNTYNNDGKTYFRSCSNAPFNFTFINQSTSTNSNYYIDWGDGSPVFNSATFSSNLQHTYTQGTWQITYIVTGSNGCLDTAYYYPFVGSNPAIGLATPGNTTICTGSDLTFSISGFGSNPPGTVYTVTFGDGTTPIVYTVPPPSTITHTFTKGSCGFTNSGYSNAFSATITASNPCSASSAIVAPIYVSQSAAATFNLGTDSACVNTPVTFTSTNLPTNSVSSTGCVPGKTVWTVTPSAGVTITSGSLGSDAGQTDPGFWTSGTANIGLKFANPGTYTIQLETGNNTCGTATATQTICINPTPTATFTLDHNSGCNPVTVQATNTSNSPVCGNNHYQWSVVYTNTGCTPNSSAFSYINGSSATSANPEFQFTSPGQYAITLVTTNPGGACSATSTTTAATTVTVKAKPIVAALTTPASICQFGTITANAPTVQNCYSSTTETYSWTFPGGTPSTSTAKNPGTITFNTTGSYTIQLDVTNECGTTTVTKSITVSPSPTATVPANQVFCNNDATGALNFSSDFPATTTYAWTNNKTSIGLAASGNGNIASFTAKNTSGLPVIATITVTPTNNGCPGLPQTFTITVNPRPSVTPTVTTIFNYCLNDPAPQLTATPTPGNTLTWYPTAALTGGSATAPTPNTSVAGTTVYWVTQSNPFGCEGPATTITVTVNPLIANNTVGNDQPICSATVPATLTPTATISGGNTSYAYQWQVSTDGGGTWNNVASSGTSASYSPPALTATTLYRRLVNSGGCSSTSNTVTITVQGALSNFNIANSQNICKSTAPALLTGQTPTGGGGSYTFQWQSSTDGLTFNDIATETGNDYQPPVLTATMYYRRKTFGTTCNGISNVVTITVNPIATVTAVTDKNYCNGSTTTAINFTSTPATNTTFAWTNDNTAIGLGASANGNIGSFTTTNSTKAPITANVTVTPTYTSGVSCPGTPLTFKINVLPVITLTQNSNSTVCAGSTVPAFVPVNDAAVFAGSSINYTWTVSTAIGLTAGSGAQVSSFTAVNNGTVDVVCNISVTPNYTYNGQTCSGTPMSYSVTVSPKPSTSVAGPNDKTCNTSYQLAGNTPTVGTGLWTVSAGPAVTFNSPNAGNSTATGLVKGTRYGFTWTISNSTCTSSASTVTVDVLSDIVNTITSDVTTNCPGQPVNFSTATLSGGDVPATLAASYTYVWESSTNNITWAVISGATSATLLANPSVNTYYRRTVSSYNKCPVISNVIQITMNSVAPAAIAGSPITLCSQTQTILAGNNPGVFVGTWTDSAPGSTLVFTPDAHTYNATVSGLVPGTAYHLVWSIASPSCGATTSNLTITDLAPITNIISPASTTVCAGQAVTLTGSIPTGGTGSFTYSWESSPDQITWTVISGQTGQNITFTPVATGYIRRNVTSGICNLESNAVSVTVQQGIANNTISANQQVCIGFPVSALTGSTPTGGDNIYTYQWQQSTDQVTWTDIPSGNQIGYQPPSAPNMTVYYRRVVTTALCTGPQKNASNAVKIAINPVAIADFTATAQNGCIPFNLGSVITSTPHNAVDASYQWFANGVSIGTGSAFPGYTIAIDGQTVVIKLLVTSSFGCDTVSKSLTFTTVKKVTASYTKDQIKGCGPLLVHFTNTSTPLVGATYAWDFGNGQTSTLVQPNPVTFQAHPLNRDTTYKIKLTATTGCSVTTYIDSVTVRPKPKAIFTPDKTIGCSPFTINLTNQSRGAPNTYTFDFGDGTTQVVNTNQAISHTYNVIKTDTVTLKLTAQNECGVDTTSYKIVIYPNLVSANFVVNGNNKAGCAPYTVKFDNNTTGANTYNYDFGDGTTAIGATSPESVLHTYTQPGTYTATFSASNGCSTATATQTITVIAAPTVKFAPTPLQSCVKDSVSFINQTTPIASYSYIWDFGDGTTGNQLNPKHVYTNPGTYTVRLTASQSAAGATCGSSVTHIVNIVPIPVAAFTSNSGGVNCAPYLLTVATTPANAFAFSWTFTDQSGTTTASGPTAQHLYTKAGLYTVKLTSFNQTGCADSITQIVKITETPKAIFTPGDSIICGNSATITFKNGSTYGGADPLTYRWFINNTQVATSKNLTYTFNPAAGTLPVVYQVKLITSSTVGCPDTVIHSMHFNPIPVAAYTVASKVGCVPFTVSITNSTIYADQYKWYLNNQLVSTVKTPPNIVLTQPSVAYTLKLVASNSLGCRADSITLGLNTYPKPKASYTIQDTVSCNGTLAINVTNTSVGAVAYTWNFGDGSPNSTATKPTYTYSTPGVYKLMLIATNNTTCPDTVIHLIEIANPPKATFTANQVSGCTLISPTFQNASINASSYLWDFGDGTTSTQKNPTHSFNYVNSPYTITLTVTGEYGCTDKSVLTNYISVAAPPIADFSVAPDTIIKIPNHTFNFTNLTPGTITKYAWDFGDGKISVDKDPSHTYADIGTYKVSLTVTNNDGCQHTRVHTVKIIPVPQYLYVPNAFEPGSSKSELKTFNVRATGLVEYNLRIFNKMGQMLFQTTTLDSNGVPTQGWDGTVDGKPVPQDVYVWDISARFLDGTSWTGMNYNDGRATTRTGIIHLVR